MSHRVIDCPWFLLSKWIIAKEALVGSFECCCDECGFYHNSVEDDYLKTLDICVELDKMFLGREPSAEEWNTEFERLWGSEDFV